MLYQIQLFKTIFRKGFNKIRLSCLSIKVIGVTQIFHWHVTVLQGAKGPAIKYFTVKTNKSQHVVLSVPAPLTAALHSQRPSEGQGCFHMDRNKWPHLHYNSYWSHNYPQTVGCMLLKDKMLTNGAVRHKKRVYSMNFMAQMMDYILLLVGGRIKVS